MLKLYDYLPSQNAWKVRQLLHHLGLEYETVQIMIFDGDGRRPDFATKNPTGAVPVLELEDGRCLPESNAILMYLAEGTPYYPDDPWLRAQVARWMFFEEDYVQNGLASLRHWMLTGKDKRYGEAAVAGKRKASEKTLSILEKHLAGREFLVECGYSIADIAMFGYVGFAHEAGIDPGAYPQLASWADRVRAQPGHLDTYHLYSIDPSSVNDIPAYED
jgi:glutathione S-transferase